MLCYRLLTPMVSDEKTTIFGVVFPVKFVTSVFKNFPLSLIYRRFIVMCLRDFLGFILIGICSAS